MKALISFLLLVSAFIACTASKQQGIEGKWSSLKGQGLTLYFRKDGSCDGFVGGKSFTSGYYETAGDTIIFREPNHDSYPAIYALRFKGDHVTWHAVTDTLTGRREAMDGHEFERIN